MSDRSTDPPSDASGGWATIRDVADEAGVSIGTVSRVLNRRKGVRPATRAAVIDAIARLDYRPDRAARELSFRQGTRVGLHIHRQGRRLTPFYMLFLEHLMEELASDGLRLEEIGSDPHGLPERTADAMLLFGARDDDPRLPYLRAAGVSAVLIGRGEGVRWVVPDDRDGGRQATEHLLRLGHERILHLTGGLETQAFFDRYLGYRDALGGAGVPYDDGLLVSCDPTPLGAYRAMRRALDGGLAVSAVFAGSDEIALGAVAALEDAGRHVPADASVVGFDDLPEVGEGLTTIRQDIRLIAATSVTLLREALDGRPPRQVVVPVRLVQRGTTARRR